MTKEGSDRAKESSEKAVNNATMSTAEVSCSQQVGACGDTLTMIVILKRTVLQ